MRGMRRVSGPSSVLVAVAILTSASEGRGAPPADAVPPVDAAPPPGAAPSTDAAPSAGSEVRGESHIDEDCPPHAPFTQSRLSTDQEALGGVAGDLWGVRRTLADAGIDLSAEVTLDNAWNTRGGTKTGYAFMGLLDLSLAIRTEPLLSWKGGRFNIAMLSYWQGNDPFGLVDDYWGWDAIATGIGPLTQISELWYEQDLFERRLTVRFGKQDANSTFATVPGAGAFISAAATYPGTLIQYLPTYPYQAVGVDIAVRPTEWLTGRFGWFDGTTNYYDADRGTTWPGTGTRGPSSFFDNPGSWFFIAELDASWSLGECPHPGAVQFGYWWQTGPIAFDAAGSTWVVDGSEGAYFGVSQTILNLAGDERASRFVNIFAQAGLGQERSNPAAWTLIAGSSAVGVIPGRERDQLGVQFNSSRFSEDARVARQPGSWQVGVEAFYRIQVTPAVAVQPDLQWIVQPDGDRDVDDALLFTLRVQVAF